MNSTDAYSPAPRKARVEIIPLIDVIFFLLATFVLFTLSLNKIKDLDVTLPAGGISSETGSGTLYLQTTEAGSYFWKIGDQSVPELITSAELLPRLANYAKQDHPRVLVRGDSSARFGAAIFALDEVRKAGIKEVSLETLVTPTGR